ncbi:MAG: acyltransferase [Bacteroidales bacterium]|nr:acyltransferase [Candidatus Sodaliphilus aphodohippi]
MIKTLSSWRGLLVVVIILYHTPIVALTEAAHMGVSMFLVMSGTLMMMRHPQVKCTWTQWMLPRARRIYTIHWLVLALIVLAMLPLGKVGSLWTLVSNAMLVHPWCPERAVYLSFNKPTWFLSALLLCYALYPMLSRVFSCLGLRGKWAIAIGVMALHCLVTASVSQPVRDWLFDMPLMRVGDYVRGMAQRQTVTADDARLPRTLRDHSTIVELVVVAVLIAVVIAVGKMPWLDWCEDVTVWWLPLSLLVLTCILVNGSEGMIGRLLSSRPLTWLGSVSLEVYMLAALVSFVYSHYIAAIAGHFGHPEFYDISWPATLPLTLLAAALLHKVTDKRT